ncbi:hypothetical protein Malapachy_1699 [Malassezia pachydermatis]|uniref:Uncharacterized protein n=1 Tax=Malassezia pachydermatis TaxID=77020 RepID=A0A0M9VN87_9BASI|nr:hypothetical protein Malapachy_1699 [Malassezia pachydermatis]KOS13083.1 hypothetical protein Malapachy_1699 [Malassezia pachydermatis]
MPLDVAGAKRPPSPTNDAPTQRVRLDRKDVSIALEYQRHIQRVTAFVVVSTTWALDTPLPCHVLQKENDTILHFSHASLEDIYIRTPWPILLGTYTAAWSDGYVLTMPTAAASRMPPIIVSTPWLALQEPVYGLACGSCGADVVRFAGPSQLRALPSEGWEELVDAWMCHGDQRLNVSVARGREDVDMHRIPAEDEVWVGTMLLKTSNAPLVPGAIDVGETTWTLQEVRIY